MIQTFWLEPTDQVAVGLRRYSTGKGYTCDEGHHQALVYTGVEVRGDDNRPMLDHQDPWWPKTCAQSCGYEFTEDDQWQMWQLRLYRRTDTGELRVLHPNASAPEAPSAEPGACWDASWLPFSKGPDGMSLMVRCPDGHDWLVDGRASNCGLPNDNEHRCWVRHGDPRECRVTVDKNGLTCNAGAGSIATPNWHGFLRNGQLVT